MSSKKKQSRKVKGSLPYHHLPNLFLKHQKNKGRGVFTSASIVKGQIVEIAPTIVLDAKEIRDTDHLYHYVFHYDDSCVLVLGYGSLYNHSYTPNLECYLVDEKMEYVALEDIKAGSELTINYNGEVDDQSPLWFDVK